MDNDQPDQPDGPRWRLASFTAVGLVVFLAAGLNIAVQPPAQTPSPRESPSARSSPTPAPSPKATPPLPTRSFPNPVATPDADPEPLEFGASASAGTTLPAMVAGLEIAVEPDATPGGGMLALTLKLPVGTLVPCLTWDASAAAFYTLDAAGTVRRIAVDGFREEVHADTGLPNGWLDRSAAGLAVASAERGELALLDPVTLAVTRRLPVPPIPRFTCSPALAFAYGIAPAGLVAVDLASGAVSRPAQPHDIAPTLDGAFTQVTATPDGRRLLAVAGDRLVRLSVASARVTLEQVGPHLPARALALAVSVDGRAVCAPTGGAPAVHQVDHLDLPPITLAGDVFGDAVGLDSKAALYFGQAPNRPLVALDAAGKPLREYPLSGGRTRQLLVHPEGRKLLALTDTHLSWVEFPGDK